MISHSTFSLRILLGICLITFGLTLLALLYETIAEAAGFAAGYYPPWNRQHLLLLAGGITFMAVGLGWLLRQPWARWAATLLLGFMTLVWTGFIFDGSYRDLIFKLAATLFVYAFSITGIALFWQVPFWEEEDSADNSPHLLDQ